MAANRSRESTGTPTQWQPCPIAADADDARPVHDAHVPPMPSPCDHILSPDSRIPTHNDRLPLPLHVAAATAYAMHRMISWRPSCIMNVNLGHRICGTRARNERAPHLEQERRSEAREQKVCLDGEPQISHASGRPTPH